MWDQDELRKEFLITTADELFVDVQGKLGVEDGGFCALYWPDSQAFRHTLLAIEAKAPDFLVTQDQAFSQAMPGIPTQPDLEPDSLRAISQAYLGHLGELVGADLADESLVQEYVGMLTAYMQAEKDFAADYAPKP